MDITHIIESICQQDIDEAQKNAAILAASSNQIADAMLMLAFDD